MTIRGQGAERDGSSAHEPGDVIRRHEVALADFFEHVRIGFHWLRLDGTILRANAVDFERLGYARDEYVGHNVAEFHVDRTVLDGLLARLLQGEPVHGLEVRLRHKNGSRRRMIVDASVVSHGGAFLHARCFSRETHEELDSEQFRLAVEAAPNGMIMVDDSGCIRLVNAQTEEMFGYRRAELIGKPVEMLLPVRYQASHVGQRRGFFAAPQRRLMGEGRDLFALHKNGREFPIEIGLNPLITRDGTFVLSTVIDITERRRARDELERHATELVAARNAALAAMRAKSEFLANMSHEIRTPLTAILGYAELLSDGRLGREERAQHLDTVRRNGEYLLTLVNDVLDLSKIDAGKMVVERVPWSLAELLRDVETLMRPRVEAKGLELTIAAHSDIPGLVIIDPTRIRQILVNLVSNSIKFTEAGSVGIGLHAKPTSPGRYLLSFSVSDTGMGIAPEVRQRLFQPFVQADASTTRRFGGTGLGLAICARLVAAIGGEIAVESEPGKGSTFRVSFEVAQASSTPRMAKLRRPTLPGTRDARSLPRLRGRILLAEDAPDNRRLLSYYLRKAGADVVVAENGKVACELSTAAQQVGQPFDVILMDMQMPAMDGYEASTLLRQLGHGVPIIALTAHAMEGDRERCLAAGCTDYVAKPVDRGTLLRCVREHLVTTQRAQSPGGRSHAPATRVANEAAARRK